MYMDYSLDRINPMTTKRIVVGGVTRQYDQNIVRLMRRSNASPDAACVIFKPKSDTNDTRKGITLPQQA